MTFKNICANYTNKKGRNHMSTTLDALEAKVMIKSINDPDKIDEIMCQLLDMSYAELTTGKPGYAFVAKDISDGFVLDAEKVLKCTMREVLTMIGYEPAAPWFEIPEDDAEFYNDALDRRLYPARHSFYLGGIMKAVQKTNHTVGQFMRIDYHGFLRYISEKFINSNDEGSSDRREVMRRGMRLNKFYAETVKFVCRYDNTKVQDELTIGDVIDVAYKRGISAWHYGDTSLKTYEEMIRDSFKIMNWFFMDIIRMNMINADRTLFKELLIRCSESEEYEYFDELNFEDCFE